MAIRKYKVAECNHKLLVIKSKDLALQKYMISPTGAELCSTSWSKFKRFKLMIESIENKVYLRLHNFDVSWEQISLLLDITPTNGWNRGDLIPNRNIPIFRKQSTWELKSTLDVEKSVSEHIYSLFKIIEPSLNKFIELAQKYNGELSIVSHVKGYTNPGYLLEKELINKIAIMNLEIDLDIYFNPI